MLNRIVQIVHRGLIRPHDGARLLHGCASILNMQLLRELPHTIVAIRGLRKTNDLAQGHHFLVKSLAAYGEIIDASISPKNKGFGKLFPLEEIFTIFIPSRLDKKLTNDIYEWFRLCSVCAASLGNLANEEI